MNTKRINKSFIILMTLLGIGLSGGILFFPMNIQNQYTCLYHRISSPDNNYSGLNGAGISTIQKKPDRAGELNLSNEKQIQEKIVHDQLITHYVSPFGLLWWGSLLVFAIAAIGLRKMIKLASSN